jgi:catechol 2,3-dioxygenase-like lactoylglutathione lyase family enzyme
MSQPIRQLAVALGLLSAVSVGHAGAEPKRPKITGIANFAAKVDNLEEARKFYKGVVGFEEAFTTTDPAVAGDLIAFKVNDRQFVEISPTLQGDEDRLIRIGFETADARGLRDYLASKGVEVPATVGTDANGNRSFVVKDPDGHAVQFVQYMNGSVHAKDRGKHLSPTRISDHILHVGLQVKDVAKADAFYKDILGFRLQWKGGPRDDAFQWISMMVPDGYDWLEYMVRPEKLTPQQLGVMHHYCLETKDIQKLHADVVARGYTPQNPPAVHARDGRWLMQMYDKNLTRTEVMVRKAANKPCCSPNYDDHPEVRGLPEYAPRTDGTTPKESKP